MGANRIDLRCVYLYDEMEAPTIAKQRASARGANGLRKEHTVVLSRRTT
jgi:hypothetical protein